MSAQDQGPSEAIQPATFEPLSGSTTKAPKRRQPVRWVLAGTAAVFALVMAFLLSARSLEIIVEAESTPSVSISGGLALPFGKRYLLHAGHYQVEVEAPGYHPFTAPVEVTDKDAQSFNAILAPLPGRLSVISSPEGAQLLVDGQPVGITPVDALSVEAGDHELSLEAQRYLPLQQTLIITGREVAQHLELSLAPAWAEVEVSSEPAGATISIDGEAQGTTPAVIEVLRGERLLTLSLPGFAPFETLLEVEAGQAQQLPGVTLVPAAGILELSSEPRGANVTVDGEFRGQTPLTLELRPAMSHRLAVFKPGYRRATDAVTLEAGESRSRTVTLRAQLGEVSFNISPPGAVLRIDGAPRGKGSQTLKLPAFTQSIEVALAGHATVRQRITPRPGLAQIVNIRLQTESEARKERIKPELTTSVGQTLLLFTPGSDSAGVAGTVSFTMGASRREPGRRANEVLHPVALSRMFYLQTTEVSNAQFRLFQATHNSGQVDSNSLNREHQPVVQVSWQQAAQFCNWLSRREGLPPFYKENQGVVVGFTAAATGYRLPTEAEWAWAARVEGEAVLKFPWGDNFPPQEPVENYADNTSAHVTGRILNGYTDGHVVSSAVASFPASAKGLYDMGGNVAEWIHDVYSIPAANGATRTDPMGAQTGDNFVIRGASWTQSKIADLRLSHRDYGQAGRDDVGFRIARYAE